MRFFKKLYVHVRNTVKVLSLIVLGIVLIFAAIVMKIAGIAYPAITLLLWYFYLWFLYGSILVGRYVKKRVSVIKA